MLKDSRKMELPVKKRVIYVLGGCRLSTQLLYLLEYPFHFTKYSVFNTASFASSNDLFNSVKGVGTFSYLLYYSAS